MADLEKTVKIIFAGEDKALSAAIDKVGGKFNQLNAVADTLSAPLARAADGVLKLDAALAALAIGGMAFSIKRAGEFENSFEEITTLITDTGDNVKTFEKDILNYAANSNKSIADINQAVYNAISAGVDYKDSLDFLNEAEKLSIASKAELSDTTKVLISTLNAYGASVEEAGKYSDILFTTVRLGQTTLSELSGSLAQVVPIAAGAGVSLETVAAALATMTVQGMPTEQAVTALKGAITSIISPTAEAAKYAAELGIEFGAQALKTRGLEQVLKDVMQATGGNIESINTLFGNVRGLSGVLALATDDSKAFAQTLNEMANSAGATSTAYEKVAEGFDNINQRIINNADIMMVTFGQKMMGFYKDVGGGLGDVFRGMTAAVDAGAFDPLFDLLDEVGGKLGEWIAEVAKILPEALEGLDFSKLLDALKSLGAAFGEYFGDIDLTQVEGLHDFIQLLIDGVTGLIKITEGMVDTFRPFFTAIADFLVSVANSDEETQEMMGTLMGFGKLIQSTSLAFVAAVKVIDKYGVSVEGIFKTIAGGAQIMFNGLQILIRTLQMVLAELAANFLWFWDKITFGLLGLEKPIKELEGYIRGLSDKIMEDGMDARRGLDKMIDGFEKLGGAAEENADKVKDATKSIADIPETKVTTWQVNTEGFQKAIDDISKEFVRVADETNENFDDIKVGVQAELDFESVDGVRYLLGDLIPEKKKVDVSIDTKKVEAQSDIIKSAMEWRAKLDITEVEEKTKQMKIMYDSIGEGLENTGDVLKDLFDQLSGASNWDRSEILDQIKAERQAREEMLALQKEMVETELEYTRAKTEAMQSGQDFMIKIEAAGLEPHLEAFMWKILENIQIRANAEAAEFLLGWNAGGA